MVDNPIETAVERSRAKTADRRAAALEAARNVPGQSMLETQQVGIDAAKRGSSVLDAAKAGLSDTAAFTVGRSVGKSYEAIQTLRREEEDPSVKAMADEVLSTSERFEDPAWNPANNDEQKQLVHDSIKELGLSVEDAGAEALMSAGSEFELGVLADEIRVDNKRMLDVSDAGTAGLLTYMLTSLVDIDTLILPQKMFSALHSVERMEKLRKLVSAGDITADEAKLLGTATTRSGNIKKGIASAAVPAFAGEGTRALLDPVADEKDVIGAVVLSTLLGGTIGTIIPTKKASDVVNDIAFTRILEDAKKKDPEATDTGNFGSAMKSVESVDGATLRGKDEAFGVDPKAHPEAHKSILSTLAEKGERAARRAARVFYKKEFYDKVVDPNMTTAQTKAIFATAIHTSVETAKDLYKKAKGDVNKLLELRAEAGHDPVRLQKLRDDINGTPVIRDVVDEDLDSVGSAATGDRAEIAISASSEQRLFQVHDYFDDNPELDAAFGGLGEFVEEGDSLVTKFARQAGEKLYEGIKKTPFISDYDRLARDAGVIGRYLSYHTLESPVGQIVNNRSAAAIVDLINREASILYAPNAPVHYKNWATDQGISRSSRDYWFDGNLRFGRAVQDYRANIHAGYTPDPNVHASVKKASEDLDRAYAKSLENTKRYGVEGFEDVEFAPGHMPTKWRGEKFAIIERTRGVGSEKVIKSLQRGIMKKVPDMDPQKALIYAVAIRRAARDGQMTSPVGGMGTIDVDGVLAIEEAIQDLGIASGDKAKELARSLTFSDSQKGTVKSSRSKIPIDMTTRIEGTTDKTLLDLIDNDIYAITDRTMRGQANHAALASVGIQQRDRASWVRAAVDEANSLGTDPQKAAKAVEDMFSYYGEGAFAGGQGPVAGRINKLAILSFLPQLGITQTAEAGVAMGVSGIRAWSHYAGQSLPSMLKGKDHGLMDGLFGVNAYIADHRLWVSTDHLDDVNLQDSHHLLKLLDRSMDKGMRGMGYISGFYKVNEFLHTTAALTMNNYMVKSIRDGKNARRLATMGVDTEFASLIRSKIKDNSIKLDDSGYVKDMGVETWDPKDLDLLRVVTRRNMDQMVQKARRGEAQSWQYKELGSLFSSLKSFTFVAAQKQLVKNLRIADPESFMMLLTTTGTAGLAYTAKQIVNGNDHNLTMERVGQGAVNWSPLLSPIMMGVDPLSYLVGLDKVPGSPFPVNSWRYGSNGLISMPAGISALNQLIQLPRLPADLVSDGDLERGSMNALKAIPVIGRSYPMIPVMEMLDRTIGPKSK